MEQQLITHLDECLAAIAADESLGSCLTRYPAEANELASLLRIAVALESLAGPAPSAATARTARMRFLNEAERRRASVKPAPAAKIYSRNGAEHRRGSVRPEPVRVRTRNLWSRILERITVPAWTAPCAPWRRRL